MRAIGTDDSINTCDCCGRSSLKFTVIMELGSGEIAHYGQVCATRNSGKDKKTIRSEIKQHQENQIAAARAEYYASAEYKAELARFAERDPKMIGRAAAEFVRDAVNCSLAARAKIAGKYGLQTHQII